MTHAYLSFNPSSFYTGKVVGTSSFSSYGNGLSDKTITKVEIPPTFDSQNVVEVGSSAFRETNIEYVFIPKTIILLNNAAFYDCLKLKEVEFEAGCALTKIDYNAFKSTIIEKIDLPASLSDVANNNVPHAIFKDAPLTCVSYLGTAQINSYMFTNSPVVHVSKNYPYSTFAQQSVSKDGNSCGTTKSLKRTRNNCTCIIKRRIPDLLCCLIICLYTS